MFAAGDWNDFADTNPGVSYYIVEYGGMPGDTTTEIITQSFTIQRVFRLSGTPTGSDVGANNVTLSLDDGNGGVTPYSFVINVANTNDVPTSADFTVNMNEDTTKTFASSDFPYTDSADDITAGDSLYSVIITSLPASGSLKASGVDVVLNQEVTPISSLTFTPIANEFGAPYASFDFKINDGEANSSLAYTVDINVTDVAEPVAPPPPPPAQKPIIFTDDDSKDSSFEIESTTFNSGTVFNTVQNGGVKLQTRKDTSGLLQHSLSVDGKTTVAVSAAPNTSVAFFKDKDGNAAVQTKASVETEDKKAVEIEVEALADGTAVHTMTIEKRVTKAIVKLAGAKTSINAKGDILTSYKESPDECTDVYVDVEIQTLHDGLTKSLFKTYNCNNELIDTKETLIDEQRFALGVVIEVKKDVNGIVIEVVTEVTQDIQF